MKKVMKAIKIATVALFCSFITIILVSIFYPIKNPAVSIYNGESACFEGFFFPHIFYSTESEYFTNEDLIIFSNKYCLRQNTVLTEGKSYSGRISPLGIEYLGKEVLINVKEEAITLKLDKTEVDNPVLVLDGIQNNMTYFAAIEGENTYRSLTNGTTTQEIRNFDFEPGREYNFYIYAKYQYEGFISGDINEVQPQEVYFSGTLVTDKNGNVTELKLLDRYSYLCFEKEGCVLGYSVEGRPIIAYKFGNGAKKIIMFGAIHGSEENTVELMDSWVKELRNNPEKIPAGKQIIVITDINPDGVAIDERLNANGVDLNRNFNTSDWKRETFLTWGQSFPNGGGQYPFSEPETRILRDLIVENSPYLTISYHSWGNYVIPTTDSYAMNIGRTYSSLSGYEFVDPNAPADAFNYSTTGAFNTWMVENGYPAMTIELSNLVDSDFEKNKEAMWRMVEL